MFLLEEWETTRVQSRGTQAGRGDPMSTHLSGTPGIKGKRKNIRFGQRGTFHWGRALAENDKGVMAQFLLVFQKSCHSAANTGLPGGQTATEAPVQGKLKVQLRRKEADLLVYKANILLGPELEVSCHSECTSDTACHLGGLQPEKGPWHCTVQKEREEGRKRGREEKKGG